MIWSCGSDDRGYVLDERHEGGDELAQDITCFRGVKDQKMISGSQG